MSAFSGSDQREQARSRPKYPGSVIVAVFAAVCALFTISLLVVPVILSVIAIVAGIDSRRRLRADDSLSGASLSALSFLVGCAVLISSIFSGSLAVFSLLA